MIDKGNQQHPKAAMGWFWLFVGALTMALLAFYFPPTKAVSKEGTDLYEFLRRPTDCSMMVSQGHDAYRSGRKDAMEVFRALDEFCGINGSLTKKSK